MKTRVSPTAKVSAITGQDVYRLAARGKPLKCEDHSVKTPGPHSG